jgi:hypothetical protein
MSELKSRPPVKLKSDLNAFLSGAEEKVSIKSESTYYKGGNFPWEEQGVRDDVTKVYNLRLSEPYLLKLKYIAEHTPNSMQKFCLKIVHDAIDAEIERLIK